MNQKDSNSAKTLESDDSQPTTSSATQEKNDGKRPIGEKSPLNLVKKAKVGCNTEVEKLAPDQFEKNKELQDENGIQKEENEKREETGENDGIEIDGNLKRGEQLLEKYMVDPPKGSCLEHLDVYFRTTNNRRRSLIVSFSKNSVGIVQKSEFTMMKLFVNFERLDWNRDKSLICRLNNKQVHKENYMDFAISTLMKLVIMMNDCLEKVTFNYNPNSRHSLKGMLKFRRSFLPLKNAYYAKSSEELENEQEKCDRIKNCVLDFSPPLNELAVNYKEDIDSDEESEDSESGIEDEENGEYEKNGEEEDEEEEEEEEEEEKEEDKEEQDVVIIKETEANGHEQQDLEGLEVTQDRAETEEETRLLNILEMAMHFHAKVMETAEKIESSQKRLEERVDTIEEMVKKIQNTE